MRFKSFFIFISLAFALLNASAQQPNFYKKSNVGPKSAEGLQPAQTNDSLSIELPKLEGRTNQFARNHNRFKHKLEGTLWQVLKTDQSEAYWDNVSMCEFILQLRLGSALSEEVLQIISAYGLILVSKSMHPELQNFFAFKGQIQTKTEVIEIAKILQLKEEIEFFEPSPKIKLVACPTNDPYVYVDGVSGLQWGLWTTQVDEVWCYYQGGSSNWTAIIDSGTDWWHEDLYNTAWYGYDYADGDLDPTPPEGFWNLTASDNIHGTHVAGIVGAEVNNGIGIAGVSNDTLYIAKVKTDDSSGPGLSSIAIINALNDISLIPEIKVVNMSFGSFSFSGSQMTAINNCWNAGKVLIAAAGNDAVNTQNTQYYPSGYENCISVSALGLDSDYSYQLANYSNYGNIDVCAPGGSASGQGPSYEFGKIYSTTPADLWGANYGYLSGTSMAAPLVAGVANTLFASNPLLTNAEARDILETQTFDFGATGYDIYFGNGVVCAWCAYEEACFQFQNNISSSDLTICPGESTIASGTYHPDISYQWFKNGSSIAGATQSSIVISSPGSYTLESTSVGLCTTNSNNLNVSYVSSPYAQFGYSVNQNSVTFNNQSNNANSYFWSFGDGSTSSLINPGHSYSAPGTYQVSLTAYNECGVSSTYISTIVISPPSGIYDDIMLRQIVWGPNPSKGSIQIESPYANIQSTFLDAAGRIIDVRVLDGSTRYEIDGLAPGHYFIRLTAPSGVSRSEKVIVIE